MGKPAKDSPANAKYTDSLRIPVDIAKYRPEGIYKQPCGKPEVIGDDNGNGVSDWEEDGNVNGPNVNLPDGALTGGFCSRKRWC